MATIEELKEVREALTTEEGYAAGCRCKYCKAVDAVLPLIDAEMDRCKINQKYANTYKHIADAFAYMLPLYLDMANEYQKAVALDVLSYLKIGKREEYSDEDERVDES